MNTKRRAKEEKSEEEEGAQEEGANGSAVPNPLAAKDMEGTEPGGG